MTKFIFCTLFGWKILGEIRLINKCVIIVAPHTHWLDFFVALPVRRILNLEINFIGKKELFFFPLNHFLKYLGFLQSFCPFPQIPQIVTFRYL